MSIKCQFLRSVWVVCSVLILPLVINYYQLINYHVSSFDIAEKLDIIERKKVVISLEDWTEEEEEELETYIKLQDNQILMTMAYTVPDIYNDKIRTYLNNYHGSFISYITYLGKGRIDFGQIVELLYLSNIEY